MREIKTSQKGVSYAKPKRLKTKQRVYSQALLMKIPHDHQEENDISLKIGRYYLLSEKPVEQNPKSELTLDNEELDSLIEYISSNYTPVSLGQGEYVNVGRSNAELINQFRSLIEGQEDKARLLIDSGILSENVYIAASSMKKVEALKSFKDALEEEYAEKYWQDWFSNNKWILGSEFSYIIDEREIDSDNIADYMMKAFDGFIDLVEIKRPNGIPFWSMTKDHNNYVPSTELIKAITQCLNYINAIENEANSAKFRDRVRGTVLKPRCTLIFGRSNDWNEEQMKAYRILNAAYNQLSVLTYDHLLDRAKNVFEIDAIT